MGLLRGHCGAITGLIQGHSGVVTGSLQDQYGAITGLLQGHYGVIAGLLHLAIAGLLRVITGLLQGYIRTPDIYLIALFYVRPLYSTVPSKILLTFQNWSASST